VFGTIAAESQRLINETYSAFVQGFMPTLARPDVDLLEGLTTEIIVDQERMGANPRSTVGTATDANAMLRIVFSRLGQPHIGSPQAYSFNVPSVSGAGAITIERGDGQTLSKTYTVTGGMCPRCEGMGSVTDFDVNALYDDTKSLNEGALTIPGYSMDGWYGRIFKSCGFFDPDKPIRDYTKKELHDLLRKEPTKIKVEGINLTYEAAAHSRLRGTGGDLHHVPRLRRYPAQRGCSIFQDKGAQHRRCLLDADQRSGRLGAGSGGAVGGAAARHAGGHARSTRSWISVWATSRSKGRPERCPAASRSAPR
jgi:excinuclease UvrABC ATPase subunit